MVPRIGVPNQKRVKKTSTQKKKIKYPVTAAVRERMKTTKENSITPAIDNYTRAAKKLGMFRVVSHESVESIEKALDECSKNTNHLVLPACLIRAFDDDVYKAAVMSFLLYMEGKLTNRKYKWFMTKYPEVEKFTGAKRKRIIQIMKELREAGIIKTQFRGIPAMQHYRIDRDMLIQLCMERILNYKDPLLELGIASIV